VLFGCLGPDHAIDDLLQEVFVSLLQTAANLSEPHRLRAYLLGAAVRCARFERRTRGRRARWLAAFRQQTSERSDSPVEGRDALRVLAEILDRLQPRVRDAYILRYVEALPPPDVAEALGVSLATAKRDIARGRERVLYYAAKEPALVDYLARPSGGVS